MRSTPVLCSFLIGLLSSTNGAPQVGQGKATSIFEFPFFASIEINGKYACAATIVDDIYVMTTKSCVDGVDIKSLGVRVGTSKQGQRGEYFKVVRIIPWKGNPFIGPAPEMNYDVAMVQVSVSFNYSPHVMWANPNADGIAELMEGDIVGWADPKKPGSSLVSQKMYVLPSQNCSQIYSGVMNISDNMYCLWPTDSSSQPCFADMGAPIHMNEQFYGLVTYNKGCDNPDMPIVITAISQLTSFMITVFCNLDNIFGSSLMHRSVVNPDSVDLQKLFSSR